MSVVVSVASRIPAQDAIHVDCAPHCPGESPQNEESAHPIWHRAMGKYQTPVSTDARRYDAVLVWERVAWPWQFDWADFG